jgi:MOSC domain-containing protein YiiM
MPMELGSVGENFTTRGVDLNSLQKGDRLKVGGCMIELTDVRTPCGSLSKWYAGLHQAMKGRSGWVCKVIVEGDVKPGDAIELVPSPTGRGLG